MKDKMILLIIPLICFILSCERESQKRTTTCVQPDKYDYLDSYYLDSSLCATDTCIKYLEIWKELLIEKNNLSQHFFDNNIQLVKSKTNKWDDGVSFRICYKLTVEWAIAYNCDNFIIKIDKDNNLYPALDLPRDTLLSKDEIGIAVGNRAFSSNITELSNSDDLKYSSMENALNTLIDYANVNELCYGEIYINDTTGNLTLSANAEYENENNSCIEAHIDLIDEKKVVNDQPCWIFK